MDADEGAGVGDEHKIVVVGHRGDIAQRAGLVGDLLAGDAAGAAIVRGKGVERAAFAEAALGDGDELTPLGDGDGAYDAVAGGELDAADAAGGASHGAGGAFVEARRHAAAGGDDQFVVARGMRDVDQLVVLVEVDRLFTALALIFVFGKVGALDGAVAGDHGEVLAVYEFVDGEQRGYLFALGEFEYVGDEGAARRAAVFGDLVRLLDVDAAGVGEHHQVGVGIDGEHGPDVVLLLGLHADNALAAAVLGGVGVGGQTLDVTGARHGDDAGVALDEVLDLDIVLGGDDGGAAVVAVLARHFR